MVLTLLRYIYSCVFFLALPVIFLRLWWKGRKAPLYRQRWRERLGLPAFSYPTTQNTLWLHAVSVGETIAATPLVKQIQALSPDVHIVFTTTTPTGSVQAKQALGQSVTHLYAPYDLPVCVAWFLKRIQPKWLCIMETELWPNTIAACAKRDIPIFLVNARLSPTSMQQYKKIKPFMKLLLSDLTHVAAQSTIDAEHFLQLGLSKCQLTVTGNIKFDASIPENFIVQGKRLKQQLGENRPIWIAASTHPGEHEQVLLAFTQLLKTHPEACLILVPRHPEQFSPAEALIQQQGLRYCLQTTIKSSTNTDTQVLLGDTMGELPMYYAAADIAFVGGSLVNTGGHNMLEPALLKLPILSGPYFFNFLEITNHLKNNHAVNIVHSTDELANTARYLLENLQQAQQMGQRAFEVTQNNQGALNAVMQLFKNLFYSSSPLQPER